jgi:hypothetical protein
MIISYRLFGPLRNGTAEDGDAQKAIDVIRTETKLLRQAPLSPTTRDRLQVVLSQSLDFWLHGKTDVYRMCLRKLDGDAVLVIPPGTNISPKCHAGDAVHGLSKHRFVFVPKSTERRTVSPKLCRIIDGYLLSGDV